MPPTIQILAEKLVTARGVDYYIATEALQGYLGKLTDVEFALEVDQIDNPDIIRYLWAMGLSRGRQSVAALKYKELTE
ncbi:hypothetical protein ES708_16740 [subsurface metagenome]